MDLVVAQAVGDVGGQAVVDHAGDAGLDEIEARIGEKAVQHDDRPAFALDAVAVGGIEIQQLVLQDVNPPGPVRPAFNEVNQAIQE